MADAETSYSAAQVDQLLRCPVCLDRYNSPKILPCQHTFCLSPCLEGLVSHGNRVIRCPECRAEHIIPWGGASAFPTNITIANFLDLPTHMSNPGREAQDGPGNACRVCEQTAVTSRCAHCEKFVCESCRRSHIGQLKVDIGRMLGQIRRSFPKISNNISNVEQRTEQIKQRGESVRSEIKNTIERYIKELRDRETQLSSELDTFLQGELRSIRMHQETLEVELASMASFCDSTETLLGNSENTTADEDLVTMKRQCTEYTEQISNIEHEPIPPTRKVRFAFIGESLHTNISEFGTLNITAPDSGSNSRPSQRNETSQPASSATRRQWSDNAPVNINSILQNQPTTSPEPNTQRNRMLHRAQNDYTSTPSTTYPRRAQQSNYTQPSIDHTFHSSDLHTDPTSTLPSRSSPSLRNNQYMYSLNRDITPIESYFRLADEPMTSPRMEALMEDIMRSREDDSGAMWAHTPRNPNISRSYAREARSGENMAALIGGGPAGRRATSWTADEHAFDQRNTNRSFTDVADRRTFDQHSAGISSSDVWNSRTQNRNRGRQNQRERVAGLMGGAEETRGPSQDPWLDLNENTQNQNGQSNPVIATTGNSEPVSPPQRTEIPNIPSRSSPPPRNVERPATVQETSRTNTEPSEGSQTQNTLQSAAATVRARWAGRGGPLNDQSVPEVGNHTDNVPRAVPATNGNLENRPAERSTAVQHRIARNAPPAESFDIPMTPPCGNRPREVNAIPKIRARNRNKHTTSTNVIIHSDNQAASTRTTTDTTAHHEPSSSNTPSQQPSSSDPQPSTSTGTVTGVANKCEPSQKKDNKEQPKASPSGAASNPPEGPTRNKTFVKEDGPQTENTPIVASSNAEGTSVDVSASKKKKKPKTKK